MHSRAPLGDAIVHQLTTRVGSARFPAVGPLAIPPLVQISDAEADVPGADSPPPRRRQVEVGALRNPATGPSCPKDSEFGL
jgi:hypothetical protein